MKCFGNTECMNRASFFCGASWLDASDKCSKPCPTGDALECDAGEACFAWTSCENTDSFYCGVSFEDASSNCAKPCPSRSSLECDDGQGCFAYTTCQGTNETSSHETDPMHVPMNDYFCGESIELASSTCSIACQSGLDSECPGNMQCYENTGCSSRDSYWCGSTWLDAAEQCHQPCSSGDSNECPTGQSCFSHTGCQANLFFCGSSFEDASETCSTPCPSRSSEECPGADQYCFAFVTDCVSDANPTRAPTNQPVKSYNYGIANSEWELGAPAHGGVGSGEVAGTQNPNDPNWYVKWEEENKSASWARSASVALTSVASFCLMMSVLL